MQNLPNGWAEARSGLYRMESKATLGGMEYSEAKIRALSTRAALFAKGTISIGGCVAKEIDISVIPQGEIPRMAEIRAYGRPRADGIDTDWLSKGVFFIDTRQMNYQTGVLTIHGYDAMLKAEQDYLSESDESEWPKTMPVVVAEIAARMGVSIDSRTKLNSSYLVQYPLNMTMREVLGYIAAAHGGNWIITDTGALRLVPLLAEFGSTDVGMKAYSLDTAPPFPTFSGVRLWLDDKSFVLAGNETGRVLEGDCPWATLVMANNIFSAIAGKIYQPFEASGARLDPAAELGDTVSIAGTESVLAYINTTFQAMYVSDIGAPAEEELDHEYPYLSKQERDTKRSIAENRSLIEKTASEIKLSVENVEGDVSELQLSSREMAARVEGTEDALAELIMEAGQVSVNVEDGQYSLQTTIDNDGTWEAVYKSLTDGKTKSGFYFDFALGRFVYDGTGIYRSADGKAYIQIENDGISVYADDGTGDVAKKMHIGFNLSGSVAYPYILLGAPENVGEAGIVKKFTNGLFIGNGHAADASGAFAPAEDYAGIFVDTKLGKTYVVNGTKMKDVYAGAEGEMALTSENISHEGDKLSDRMPVCLTQAEYDAMVAAGTYNEDTPYLIKKEA